MYLHTRMNIPGRGIRNLEPEQDTHRHVFCSRDLDLDLDPMTLTYELELKILKTTCPPKSERSRLKLSKVTALQTDSHTDRHTRRRDRKRYRSGKNTVSVLLMASSLTTFRIGEVYNEQAAAAVCRRHSQGNSGDHLQSDSDAGR